MKAFYLIHDQQKLWQNSKLWLEISSSIWAPIGLYISNAQHCTNKTKYVICPSCEKVYWVLFLLRKKSLLWYYFFSLIFSDRRFVSQIRVLAKWRQKFVPNYVCNHDKLIGVLSCRHPPLFISPVITNQIGLHSSYYNW